MTKPDKAPLRPPLDAKPYLSLPKMVRISTFVSEARQFLNEYFKGSWIEEPPEYRFTKHILVSADCFAYFTKVIFKRVFNRELIVMSSELDDKTFRITFNFSTSYLREDDFEKLSLIAELSGFSFEHTESSASLVSNVYSSAVIHVYAGRPMYVYNALLDVFRDDHLYPV